MLITDKLIDTFVLCEMKHHFLQQGITPETSGLVYW